MILSWLWCAFVREKKIETWNVILWSPLNVTSNQRIWQGLRQIYQGFRNLSQTQHHQDYWFSTHSQFLSETKERKYVLVSSKNKHIPFLLFIGTIIPIHAASEHIVILQKMMPQQNWLFDTFVIGDIFTNHQWSMDQHKVPGPGRVMSCHHSLLSSAHW